MTLVEHEEYNPEIGETIDLSHSWFESEECFFLIFNFFSNLTSLLYNHLSGCVYQAVNDFQIFSFSHLLTVFIVQIIHSFIQS